MKPLSPSLLPLSKPPLLITGATGFLGSRLAQYCQSLGFQCSLIVRAASDCSGLPNENCTIVTYKNTIESLLEGLHKDTLVLHIASYYVAVHEPHHVDQLLDANVRFGTHLLEAMRQKGASKLVLVGTSWQSFEKCARRPVNLYAATKQIMEDLAAYYVDAYDFAVTAVRLFDTYGEGDKRLKLIERLLRTAIQQTSLDLSPGEQLLDLMHVDDLLSALLTVINGFPERGFHSFNLTSGRRISIQSLVALIEEITGLEMKVNFGGCSYRKREVMVPTSHAALVGWVPSVSLEDGLKRMYNYLLSEESV